MNKLCNVILEVDETNTIVVRVYQEGEVYNGKDNDIQFDELLDTLIDTYDIDPDELIARIQFMKDNK